MTAKRRLAPEMYAALANRYLVQDQMMWQTPALSLTAEAFLFTIALSAGNSEPARLMASSLALVVSVLSVQLMLKHQHYSSMARELLDRIEVEEGVLQLIRTPIHGKRRRLEAALGLPAPALLLRLPSIIVWVAGLSLFGVAAVVVLILTAVSPNFFGG